MRFWSGTAFMKTSEAVAVARMFDEAGYDGIVCSDHLIYPRELSSPYPDSPTGKPMWSPDTAWPDSWVLIGAMAAVTRRLRFSNATGSVQARRRHRHHGGDVCPWAGLDPPSGDARTIPGARFDRFAETIIEKIG